MLFQMRKVVSMCEAITPFQQHKIKLSLNINKTNNTKKKEKHNFFG